MCTQEEHTITQLRATFGIHEPCVCQLQQQRGSIPLIVKEIAEEQHNNKSLHAPLSDDNYEMLIIENTKVLCKNGKLVPV